MRRLEVATTTAPRVKVTKRKSQPEDSPIDIFPKRTKLGEQFEHTTETPSTFHTSAHFLLRDWVYNDQGDGHEGLDDELRAESSPALSAVKTDLVDLRGDGSPDDLWRLYKLFKGELLWYFGDSDCNWFPFMIKASQSDRKKTTPQIFLSALQLNPKTGTKTHLS